MKTKQPTYSLNSPFVAIVGFFIPIILIYAKILGYDFIEIDDGGQITDNEHVKSLNIQSIIALFSTPVVGMFQPLTSIANAVVVALFGLDATPLRVLSLMLHTLNTCLFYHTAKHLLAHPGKAVIIALIFAVHPLMVEAVTWISAISTLWFTLFFLLSLKFYLDYLEQPAPILLSKSLACFIIGALFKVQIVPLVGVLFLCDYFLHKQRSIRSLLLNKIPFILIGLIFLAIAVSFRSGISGFPDYDYSPHLLLPTQLTWYIIKLILPIQLGIQYDWPKEIFSFFTFFSYAFMFFLFYLIFKKKDNPLFLFGVFFFIGNIILHTTPFTQFLGPYADRYAYLSSFGILIAFFSLIPNQLMQKLYWVFSIIIIIYASLAFKQVRVWENTLSVWSNNLQHQSATFSFGMRGALFFQQGRLQEAQSDFQKVADNPDQRLDHEKYAYLYTQLAVMLINDDLEKSYQYFSKAVEYKHSPKTLLNLAMIGQRTKRYEESEQHYYQVIGHTPPQSPSHIQALDGLSALLFHAERFSELRSVLSQLLKIQPNNLAAIKKRAFINFKLGDQQAAQSDLNTALQLAELQGGTHKDLMLEQIKKAVQGMSQ